jgi:hypothetical protein
MIWLAHLLAIIFFPPLLIVTIALHWLGNKSRKK